MQCPFFAESNNYSSLMLFTSAALPFPLFSSLLCFRLDVRKNKKHDLILISPPPPTYLLHHSKSAAPSPLIPRMVRLVLSWHETGCLLQVQTPLVQFLRREEREPWVSLPICAYPYAYAYVMELFIQSSRPIVIGVDGVRK